MFGDGNFIRVVWECAADKSKEITKPARSKSLGGGQNLFPSEALCLKRLLVFPCAPSQPYWENMTYWEPELEPVPPGQLPARQILNLDRDFVMDPNFQRRDPDKVGRWVPEGIKKKGKGVVVRLQKLLHDAGTRPGVGGPIWEGRWEGRR